MVSDMKEPSLLDFLSLAVPLSSVLVSLCATVAAYMTYPAPPGTDHLCRAAGLWVVRPMSWSVARGGRAIVGPAPGHDLRCGSCVSGLAGTSAAAEK